MVRATCRGGGLVGANPFAVSDLSEETEDLEDPEGEKCLAISLQSVEKSPPDESSPAANQEPESQEMRDQEGWNDRGRDEERRSQASGFVSRRLPSTRSQTRPYFWIRE